jgi:hypothetical protein
MSKKFEEYLNNPYRVIGLVERAFATKDGETLTVDPNTGEYYTMKRVVKNSMVKHDELVYAKLFQSAVSQLMDLPHPALKIVMYAIGTVRPLNQTVILNPPDVAEFCKIATGTYYNNLYVLLDRKIISKKLGSSIEFWYDPNVFFNGNRIRMLSRSNNSRLNLENEV